MRVRGWFRLFAMLAVFGLIVASCSSDDDDEGGGSGNGGGTEDAATCEGTPGEADTIPPPSGGTADGAGKKVGLILDLGGKDDKSFNQAANLGLETAAEDFGVEVELLEPAGDGSNRGDLLRSMAEEGVPFIIGNGFAFAESMKEVAADFPDTKFAIVDDATLADVPNVTSLVFAEEQGSYLMGIAAARASKTGKIGFIGGVETELIQKFEAGYKAGAESVNEDIEIDVKYITQIPDFTGFNAAPKAKTIAEGMYANDVDVIFPAAGASGKGVFPVSAAEDRLAIGVDSNQYQQVVAAEQECMLTSMIKRVDAAVYTAIEEFLNGELKGGEARFDLESGLIGYATDGGQLGDITAELDEAKEKIVSGEIEVPVKP